MVFLNLIYLLFNQDLIMAFIEKVWRCWLHLERYWLTFSNIWDGRRFILFIIGLGGGTLISWVLRDRFISFTLTCPKEKFCCLHLLLRLLIHRWVGILLRLLVRCANWSSGLIIMLLSLLVWGPRLWLKHRLILWRWGDWLLCSSRRHLRLSCGLWFWFGLFCGC